MSGDLATTANLALVVSGVPTRGEKTKASGASGPSGSTSRRRKAVHEPGAEAGAADIGAQDLLGQRQRFCGRVGGVHNERAAEVAARGAVPLHA